MDKTQVRAALLQMAEADQRVRAEVSDHTNVDGIVEPVFLRRWQTLDRSHTAVLREIVAEHGWPGRTFAGVDGAEAAWLLAQHAELDDQLTFWPLLSDAVAAGEATDIQLAFLEDRIAMRQRRPQTYGTQMIRHEGETLFSLYDTSDMDGLDQRRAAIGLGPVADQLAHTNAPYRYVADDNSQ